MQSVVFMGRLAAEPQVTDDFGRAVFRLLENRGQDAQGQDRVVGINCVSWVKGLNQRVIAKRLTKGCEVLVTGGFTDNDYEAADGVRRTGKELVVRTLTVLDWAMSSSAYETHAAA